LTTETKKIPGKRARDRAATEAKLVAALETVILREGAEGLGVNKIADEAGVGKDLLYRYYGGLSGLITHWVTESTNWPTALELIGGDKDDFKALSDRDRIKRTFINYLRALRSRPVLVQIMAAQLMQPTELTLPFEKASAKISDELTEIVKEISSINVQRIASLSLILISSANYLAIRSTKQPVFYGLDLSSNASWHHIEGILEEIIDVYWDLDDKSAS